MLKLIKHTIITLGIPCGIIAAMFFVGDYLEKQPSKLEVCRAMVLAEVGKNQQFVDAVATPDFLTAMTRGK